MNFNSLVEIAGNVATPLALGGVLAALFFGLAKTFIHPNFIGRLENSHAAELLRMLFTFFFVLSLVAIVLGGFCYVVKLFAPTDPKTSARSAAIISYEQLVTRMQNESRNILDIYGRDYARLRKEGIDDAETERILITESRNRIEESVKPTTFVRLLKDAFPEIAPEKWDFFLVKAEKNSKNFVRQSMLL